MPRKPRVHFPGAFYHVMVRGNAGQPVFFADSDRSRFYLILQEAIERFNCRVHAFCCMTDHIHLALEVSDVSVSRIMQNVSLRYTAWINRSYHRSGHLFQGRFKAIVIDAESYLLQLVRYIHLNPVRAGVVCTPEEYVWSGHNSYLGMDVLPWLTMDLVLSIFSAGKRTSRRNYSEFLAEGLSDDERQECHAGTFQGRILGDEEFVDHALRRSVHSERRPVTVEDIIEKVCLHYRIQASELGKPGKSRLYSEARAVAALLVRELPDLSLTELARIVRRDAITMSQAARRLAEKARVDSPLAETIARLLALLATNGRDES